MKRAIGTGMNTNRRQRISHGKSHRRGTSLVQAAAASVASTQENRRRVMERNGIKVMNELPRLVVPVRRRSRPRVHQAER